MKDFKSNGDNGSKSLKIFKRKIGFTDMLEKSRAERTGPQKEQEVY